MNVSSTVLFLAITGASAAAAAAAANAESTPPAPSVAGSSDPDLAQFAKKPLPTLKEPEVLAQKLPSQ